MHTELLKYVLDKEHERISDELIDIIGYNRLLIKHGAYCNSYVKNEWNVSFVMKRNEEIIRIFRIDIVFFDKYLYEFERKEKLKRLIKK